MADVLNRRTFNALLGGTLGSSLMPNLAFAQTPRKGGRVRVAMAQQSTNDTFDSARFSNANDYIRGSAVFNTLTRLDPAGMPKPELALSWEANAAATEWRFKIRPDVVFSDGQPLKIEDVVYSIMRHAGENTASSAKPLVSNIQSVRKEGNDQLVVTLLGADVEIPILFGLLQFAIVKEGTTDFSKPLGTGPFVMAAFQPGIRTILKRNERFWQEGKPYLDEIEMISITDLNARVSALLSGDIDMAADVRGPGIGQIEANPSTKLFTTESTRYAGFQFDVARAPGSNQDLGLAITYLFNRQKIVDLVLQGHGTVANDHPIGKMSPYYNKDLPQREFDLDKAKFHLKKSAIGTTPVELSVSDGVVYSVDIAQLLQREAARAGLDLKLRREPSESYWTAVAGKRPYFATNFFARPSPNLLLDVTWKTGSQWNYSHYSSARLDELIGLARATLDLQKRTAMYHEMQTILHGSGALSMPVFMSYIDGVSRRVQGLVPNQLGNFSAFRFADQIWLA
ncbi:ABC transporter substrate-binding protein (plasmid) [Bosea vestrisii]|uniref:ABC transporter substrate-binding protein n=1 Tax=Bosea vestrisii TaxID=151416 RepID=UPI0024E00AB4|nr:ABC transporter substrate-binding protein [Bosea vestrisii]WID99932.1 ABC transporter substrate-binding protein [Bosea vestrisii]